jgi:hypothetical protein
MHTLVAAARGWIPPPRAAAASGIQDSIYQFLSAMCTDCSVCCLFLLSAGKLVKESEY